MIRVERIRDKIRRRGLIPGCVKWGHDGNAVRNIFRFRGEETLEIYRTAVRNGHNRKSLLRLAREAVASRRETARRWYDAGGRLP